MTRLKSLFQCKKRENNKDNVLKLSFWEFLKVNYQIPWMKLTDREKIMKTALKIYKKEIDILNIIKKLHDIDKIKNILLNEEQIKSFQLIKKPSFFKIIDKSLKKKSLKDLQRIDQLN